MKNIQAALEVLEDNNNFLKDYSKGDDEFYQRYSDGFDAIGDIENYHNELKQKYSKLLDDIHDYKHKYYSMKLTIINLCRHFNVTNEEELQQIYLKGK